jgi:type I restriction enzyme S subunit
MSFPLVPLGELLVERRERIGTPDADGLPLLGVSNQEGLHRSGKERIPDMSRYFRVERDWFAYNPMRINVGSIGWAETDGQTGVISPDYVVFSCGDRVLPWLVYLFLRSPTGLDAINQETAGSVRERLYFESLGRVRFPLPPFAEQRRIVARVEAVAARVAEARRLREEATAEADHLTARVADTLFAQLEAEHGSKRFSDFDPHVTSGPRNWAARYADGGLRFYRAQDILPEGRLATSGKVFIEPPDSNQGQGAQLQPGDLMMVITGATVGRVAEYPTGIEPGYVSQHVAICRLPQAAILPGFALWRLLGTGGQAELTGQRYGQGKPGLNLTNIRNLTLPVPPLVEQRRIVAHLDALQAKADALRSLQAETTAELDALLPAVLAKAFAGEL